MQLFILILSYILGIHAALDQDYVVSIIKDVIDVGEKCAQQVGATPEDMSEVRLYKLPPTTHEGKCVLACFYKAYHLMTNDGTWDEEAVGAAFAPIKEMDVDIYNNIITVLKSCEHLPIQEDHCETASVMGTCLRDGLKKAGIRKTDFLPKKV